MNPVLIVFILTLLITLTTTFGQDEDEEDEFPRTRRFKNTNEDYSEERVLQPRIAGGHAVRNVGMIPYHLQLRYLDEYLCGAALVISPYGNQVVITTGNCITAIRSNKMLSPKHISIIGGRVRINGVHVYEQFRTAMKISRHPDWRRSPVLYHDIAVIHPNKPFEINRLVQPVDLTNKFKTHPTGDIIISGWGFTDPSQKHRSIYLKLSSIKSVTNADCNKAYKWTSIGESIPSLAFCAGTPKSRIFQGACQGDEGSPATNVWNYTLYLVGVFSFGHPKCGNRFQPSVYTDLSFYLRWINVVAHPALANRSSGYSD